MNFDQSIVERLVRFFMPKTTSQNVEAFLDKLQKECSRVNKWKSAVIPTFKEAPVKGNVLYINGSYKPFDDQSTPDAILKSYRDDTRLILRFIAGESFKQNFVGTCISFYEVPEKGNIRVYRTIVNNNDLDNVDRLEHEFINNEFSAHPRLIERYESKIIRLKKDKTDHS
jgi:hypothetical protein